WHLSQEHGRFPACPRRHLRPREGRCFRFHRGTDGLLSRLSFAWRRPGCWQGDHQCSGHRLDPDPDLQLYRHGAVLRAMSNDLKIKVRGLSKAFGRKVVLNNLDLDVHRGRSLVVIGGSGTGKSVLIKCILGLLTPDKGSIEIDGVEMIGASSEVRETAMRKF